MNLYSKIENYIDIIYFTDRQSFTKEEYAIFLSFDLNFSKNPDELYRDITMFVHCLIDLLCINAGKLSSNVFN
jgi:hypothetical protein